MQLRNLALAVTLAAGTSVSPAQSLAPIHAKCAIGLSESGSNSLSKSVIRIAPATATAARISATSR